MPQDDIRIVDLGDGTAVWLNAGERADPAPRAPRRRWVRWAACGVGVAALAGAAIALLA
jgi:hypothetical protein